MLLNTSHFLPSNLPFQMRKLEVRQLERVTQDSDGKERGKCLLCSSPWFIHEDLLSLMHQSLEKLRQDGNELWGMRVKIIQKVGKGQVPSHCHFLLYWTWSMAFMMHLGQWWWAHLCYCWVLITNWQLFWVHIRLVTKPVALCIISPLN